MFLFDLLRSLLYRLAQVLAYRFHLLAVFDLLGSRLYCLAQVLAYH